MTRGRIMMLSFVAVACGAALVAVRGELGRSSEGYDDEMTRPTDSKPFAPAALHDVVLRKPVAPRIATDLADHAGNPITIACGACHTSPLENRAAGAAPRRDAATLRDFHQGLVFRHGELACTSCHNASDAYDSLRLADGTPVPFPEVLTLCAQCHGTQFDDFVHGAHGGMIGFWDLSRGGRVRNNCIDCHDPHAPTFVRMAPTFKPIDRFLSDREPHAGGERSHE